MKLNVSGRQMNVFDETKEHIAKKMAKLDKYFPEEATADVTLSRKHGVSTMEITINSDGTLYRSEQGAEDFRSALDRCIETIERQIRKNKTRLARRLRTALPEEEDFFAVEDEEQEHVIRVKEFSLKPMSVEEAILEMNLLGHSFFVFRDDITNRTCVVYARRDGDYGMIVPQE
mgnify:CR=1 FL=1